MKGPPLNSEDPGIASWKGAKSVSFTSSVIGPERTDTFAQGDQTDL